MQKGNIVKLNKGHCSALKHNSRYIVLEVSPADHAILAERLDNGVPTGVYYLLDINHCTIVKED